MSRAVERKVLIYDATKQRKVVFWAPDESHLVVIGTPKVIPGMPRLGGMSAVFSANSKTVLYICHADPDSRLEVFRQDFAAGKNVFRPQD